MTEQRVQRRLAAILAADVVGYSRLMGADEEGTLKALSAHLSELIRPCIADHGGRLVKTTGDGILAEFPSVIDAVRCAVAFQDGVGKRNTDIPAERRIEFRIGVNLGDVIIQDDDVFGDGVNIAARLESLSDAGAICVSGAVYEQVRQKLQLAFEDMGEQKVKNIKEPVRAWRIATAAEPAKEGAGESPAADVLFARPAVAVLPFANMSADPEQGYFADGLTEDIITALSLWRSFPVIARNSTFVYKGQSVNVAEVGREFGARYVIEGSVRRAGERLRVTAQLINTATGHHVWAERYDRSIADIFDLQDELTQRIAATVVPELEHAEHSHAALQPPRNLDAWMWYVRGGAELYEPSGDALRRARQMLARAIELDPSYARAHAAVAFSHAMDLLLGTAESRDASLRGLEESARKAVSLDHDDSTAQMVMSFHYTWTEQDDLAVATAERAVALNPNNANAHGHLGTLLDLIGRHEEGIANLENSLRLNPKEPTTAHVHKMFLARANLALRRYEQTILWGREALAQRAGFAPAQYLVAIALAHLDRIEEARTALNECERWHPGFIAMRRDWQPYRDQSVNDHIRKGLLKIVPPA